jgi:hypothetical protein
MRGVLQVSEAQLCPRRLFESRAFEDLILTRTTLDDVIRCLSIIWAPEISVPLIEGFNKLHDVS